MPAIAADSARLHGLVLTGVLGLAACPAPTPTPTPAPSPEPRAAEPVVTPEPNPVQAPEPSPSEPSPSEPSPSEPLDPSMPAALADASALTRTMWTAIEAIDAGDHEAMSRAMLPTARWFPPGSALESVGNDSGMIPRAMAPWSSPEVELDFRRVIETEGPTVIQLSMTHVSEPTLHNEAVLLVLGRDDQIASVRHYGDPLGPLRLPPEGGESTLDLGPTDPLSVHRDPPDAANLTVVGALDQALEDRNDTDARARLADAVVLHDIKGRRSRKGTDAYLEDTKAMLGKSGHLLVLHEFACGPFVVMEGAVYGIEEDEEGNALEHGLVDVHRLADGVIAETWRYLNRRGRPHRRKALADPRP